MVEQSDRAPLLDWEEIPTPGPIQAVPLAHVNENASERSPPPDGHTLGGTTPGTGWSTTSPGGPESVAAVVTSERASPARLGAEHSVPGWDIPSPLRADHTFPGLSAKEQWEEKDQIVAVFVVTFDTRSGEQQHQVPTVISRNRRLWILLTEWGMTLHNVD